MLEKAMIAGITHAREAVYEVEGVDSTDLFAALAEAAVNVDTFIQIGADVVFSAPLGDRRETAAALDGLGAAWSQHDGLGKVSLVGAGMKSHPGIAAQAFSALREASVRPRFVSTSPIKIAFFVPDADVERSVRALHETFELSLAKAERRHA